MESTFILKRLITKEEEGSYLSLGFPVPDMVETMTITYQYGKADSIVDFGITGPDGEFIGWSGSDRDTISVCAENSSEGFASVPVRAGQWHVLLGAYKIASSGVEVTCSVEFIFKRLRRFKGDTHLHTCASDGRLTPEEMEMLAKKDGLEFLFITDHNNYAQNDRLPSGNGVTMIPGVEWTTYKGHAGMLGRKRAFLNFASNSFEETKEIFQQAREQGALIVLNHPFCPFCGWKWGMDGLPWDMVEVWNGGVLPEANLEALKWWDLQLKAGRKISVTGGSDFHYFEPGRMPAMPCTCVFAWSSEAEDILDALRKGHCFITISSRGPMLRIDHADFLPGDTIHAGNSIKWEIENLKTGDLLRIVGKNSVEEIICAGSETIIERTAKEEEGYLRLEIWRSILQGMNQSPVLISNPYYIE